jgi:hypothetical protein
MYAVIVVFIAGRTLDGVRFKLAAISTDSRTETYAERILSRQALSHSMVPFDRVHSKCHKSCQPGLPSSHRPTELRDALSKNAVLRVDYTDGA